MKAAAAIIGTFCVMAGFGVAKMGGGFGLTYFGLGVFVGALLVWSSGKTLP